MWKSSSNPDQAKRSKGLSSALLGDPVPNSKIAFAGLALFIVTSSLFLKKAVLGQFDPNDYGGLLDVVWRIFHGQKPYVDFIFHMPPIFIYTMTFFAVLFGFGKGGVLAHLIAMTTGISFLTFFMVRKKLSVFTTLLVTALSTAGFYLHHPFPMFTHDAFFFSAIGIFALAGTLPFADPKKAFRAGLLCGISAALAVMTKPNIGVAFGLVFAAVLILDVYREHSFKGFLGGGVLIALLCIPLEHDVGRFIFTVTTYISTQKERLSSLLDFQVLLANGYWLPAALALPCIDLKDRRIWSRAALLLGVTAATIFIYSTSSFRTASHIPLVGMCTALSFLLLRDAQASKDGRETRREISAVLLAFSALFQIIQTSLYACDVAFQKNAHSVNSYILRSEPLTGWHTGVAMGGYLDAMADTIKSTVPKEDSFLVLSPIPILYSLTQRESYPNVPFQFVRDVDPAPGKQQAEVTEAILRNPPKWIITHRDQGPFRTNILLPYLGLEDYVLENYAVVETWGPYALFKRKS